MELGIYFKEEARDPDIFALQKQMESLHFVKSAQYISKEEALKIMQADEEVKVLGFNPYPKSLSIRFDADFVTKDSLEKIKKKFENHITVREILYNKEQIENIDRNVRMAGIILLSLSLLMGIVSFLLINNTIRLTLYSKRFLIKSMQLVGATQGFIRKPFVMQGAILGLVSSLFAAALLVFSLWLFTIKFPELAEIRNYFILSGFILGLISLGVFLSGLSSYFAINKYLRMKLDQLF